MSQIDDFLRELDAAWTATDHRVTLELIGSTALFLQTDYVRGTKDSDVLETDELDAEVRAALIRLGGPGTALHRRHRMYVDVVGRAIPFLAWDPLWHPRDLGLEHLEVVTLDVADVVVSKLARFHADDRDDIQTMVESGRCDHDRALDRLRSVIDRYQYDARCDRLPVMVERFHRVERDWYGIAETPIHLPDHIFR